MKETAAQQITAVLPFNHIFKVDSIMKIDDLIEKCTEAPEIKEERCSFGRRLVLDRGEDFGFLHFLPLFPGITLAYIKINALTWPAPTLYPEGSAGEFSQPGQTVQAQPSSAPARLKGPLLINYCISGRCELLLNTDNYVYIQSGELSLTESYAANQYLYPGRFYEGMEFFIDLDSVSLEAPWMKTEFGLSLTALTERYCPACSTYIAGAASEPDWIFQKLWTLYQPEDPGSVQQMRVYSLSLLSALQSARAIVPAQQHTFYTKSQVEIAKKTEQILTGDLSQHHPARELADSFSISETSLKNYFRGVYGENISSYMQKKRMEKAGELLLKTSLPVSDIALQTGYSSQSKFAAVFRKFYQAAPLEYRRRQHL